VSNALYITDFNQEFKNTPLTPFNYEDLIFHASKSKIILVADYHPLHQPKFFLNRFIDDLYKIDKNLIIGTDILFTRDQNHLDDYLDEKISEKEFLTKVDYKKYWVYPWEFYSNIFKDAKNSGIKIFALDTYSENNLKFIRRRDQNMAWKICELINMFPDHTIIVFTGESRISIGHLPKEISKFLGGKHTNSMRIFQNLDAIYKNLGHSYDNCYCLNDDTFCVMNASKFLKKASFREIRKILNQGFEGDDKTDLEGTIYNLIDQLLKFLNIDRFDFVLESFKGLSPIIVDNYPKISSVADIKGKNPISMFIPLENRIIISSFDIVHGGEEISHYVNSALKGELYKPIEYKNDFDQFYIKTIEESIGYFGSKIFVEKREFNSIGNFSKWDRKILKHVIDRFGYDDVELREASEFINTHHKFEKNIDSFKKVPDIIEKYITKENKLTPLLFHDLGYRLGEILYKGFQSKELSKRWIKRLFEEKFTTSGKSFETYIELVKLYSKHI
jgi:hypothetical protein